MACSQKIPLGEEFLTSLADTLDGADERLAFLTDGAGGWYFDKVNRSSDVAAQGWHWLDLHLLLGWQIETIDMVRLDDDLKQAIVHPLWIERHYGSGLVERVEALYGEAGLIVTLTLPRRDRVVIRDIPAPAIVVEARQSEPGSTRSASHPEYRLWRTPGDDLLTGRTIRFAYIAAGDSITGRERGRRLLDGLETLFLHRDSLYSAAMERFAFRCDDRRIERAVGWAQTSLLKSVVYYDGKTYLLAGMPHSPSMESRFALMSLPGLALVKGSRKSCDDIMRSMLMVSDSTTGFPDGDALPGQRNNLPALIGLWALEQERLSRDYSVSDTTLASRLTLAMAQILASQLDTAAVRYGLFTGDSPYFDVVKGDSIFQVDVQALYGIARRHLLRYDRSGTLPEASLSGVPRWESPDIPPVAFGSDDRQYIIPLTIEAGFAAFWQLPQSRSLPALTFNSIPPRRKGGLTTYRLTPTGMPTPAMAYALGWLYPDHQRHNRNLLEYLEGAQIIGNYGMRVPSRERAEMEAVEWHIDELYDPPTGDMVWTSGRLADIYRLDGQTDAMIELFDRLSGAVLSGLIGGLPTIVYDESVKQSTGGFTDDQFTLANAEYLRLFIDDIWGLRASEGRQLTFSPRLPEAWGNVALTFSLKGCTFYLERPADEHWRVTLLRATEPIPFSVELIIEDGKRAIGSRQLNNGERYAIVPFTRDNEHWNLDFKEPGGLGE
ncbi:MAG: hypothetical protein FJY67_08010 [Calditrichaeota bacterium]|nr:hypothetical protein [Calditrichota bacterium]